MGLFVWYAYAKSGGDMHRFAQILGAFPALVLVGVVFLIVVGILFLVLRKLIRTKLASSPRALSKVTALSPADLVAQLRATDWYQFEKLVGLVYAARGYTLNRRGGANPDGGIDLIIESNGEQTAVQCKRWKKWKVDVPRIREFIGALTVAGIRKGIVVALNGFTLEAKQLAVANNIDIVHEENLALMISGLPESDQRRVQVLLQDETKRCPKCESVMVLRTPNPGENWTPFWGCCRYPACRGKLQDN